jgi:acyl carrier protein
MTPTPLSYNPEELSAQVIAVLNEVTMDWELDLEEEIGPSTRLIDDLAFESIDIVRFVVALEQHFNCKGLPFEKLFMRDGDYVDELRVNEVVDFLSKSLPTTHSS